MEVEDLSNSYDVVITIVDKGLTEKIVDEIDKNGVSGVTILPGRGRSTKTPMYLFGLVIEPERDCIIVLTPSAKTDEVFEIIMTTGNLQNPGQGLVLVLDLKKVGGIHA